MREVIKLNGFTVINITTDREEDKKDAVRKLEYYFSNNSSNNRDNK